MPRPYSIDLRKRVLEAVDEKKLSIEEISKRFTVNPKTIYLWRKRREETGRIEAITKYQKGHSHKIKNLSNFKEFIEENPGCNTDKIIERMGNMCKKTVYNYFKKINYTYKKNLSVSRKK